MPGEKQTFYRSVVSVPIPAVIHTEVNGIPLPKLEGFPFTTEQLHQFAVGVLGYPPQESDFQFVLPQLMSISEKHGRSYEPSDFETDVPDDEQIIMQLGKNRY